MCVNGMWCAFCPVKEFPQMGIERNICVNHDRFLCFTWFYTIGIACAIFSARVITSWIYRIFSISFLAISTALLGLLRLSWTV